MNFKFIVLGKNVHEELWEECRIYPSYEKAEEYIKQSLSQEYKDYYKIEKVWS